MQGIKPIHHGLSDGFFCTEMFHLDVIFFTSERWIQCFILTWKVCNSQEQTALVLHVLVLCNHVVPLVCAEIGFI